MEYLKIAYNKSKIPRHFSSEIREKHPPEIYLKILLENL